MICDDSVCQELMTCKWDMSVASPYCGAIWYPMPEKDKPSPETLELAKERINKARQSTRRYQEEFYGRRSVNKGQE